MITKSPLREFRILSNGSRYQVIARHLRKPRRWLGWKRVGSVWADRKDAVATIRIEMFVDACASNDWRDVTYDDDPLIKELIDA